MSTLSPTDARWIYLLAGLLYPWGGYVCLALIPGAHEDPTQRLVIGGACLGVLALSFASQRVAALLPHGLLAVYLVITLHYLSVVHAHPNSTPFLTGLFIIVGTINACIQRRDHATIYALVLLGSTIAMAWSDADASTNVIMLFGLVIFQVSMLVSLQARVHARKRLEDARAALEASNTLLLAADRYKDEFLAIISHELRTPLNVVMGFTELLEDEVSGPLLPAQRDQLVQIGSATQALAALVDDLLDMSRLQAGRFMIARQPVDLAAIARDVLDNLEPLARAAGQQLRLAQPDPLPELTADPRRVGQVLTNLVANAIKFNRPGEEVLVTLRAGPRVRCEVRDHGEGIADVDLPRLFLPFSQLAPSATRRTRGSGLGLSICKALVEAHGGEIGVESIPGTGSSFWFSLPATDGYNEPLVVHPVSL